jgi:hypothetical protein
VATLGVGAFALVGLVLRLAAVARPVAVVDRLFVPDDTYYTLTIARSIAHGHGPTTDGTTLTSGFQPLLGFLMTPVYWATGSLDRGVRIDLLLLAGADVATVVVVAWIAFRVAGRLAALVAAAIWAVSPIAITSAAGGLETSLAMFAAVALVAVWIAANDHPSTRRWLAVGAVAGLAVLARIDLVLLVVLLAGVQLWRGPRRGLAASAAAGGVVVGPWWIWCSLKFGTPLPTSGSAAHALARGDSFASATTSLAFGAVAGGPFVQLQHPRIWLMHHTVIGTFAFWLVVVALVALGVALLVPSARRRDVLDAPSAAVAVLVAFAAGLLVFYVWFGVPWYLSRYLAPVELVVTLLLAIGCARLTRLSGSRVRTLTAAVLGAVLVAGFAASAVSIRTALTATTRGPSQLDAATGFREPVRAALAFLPGGARIGGFQSGALGYYGSARHTVVNLDGVVNPDAYRARRAHRTGAYIRSRHLAWLIDSHVLIAEFAGSDRSGRAGVHVATVRNISVADADGYVVARVDGARRAARAAP